MASHYTTALTTDEVLDEALFPNDVSIIPSAVSPPEPLCPRMRKIIRKFVVEAVDLFGHRMKDEGALQWGILSFDNVMTRHASYNPAWEISVNAKDMLKFDFPFMQPNEVGFMIRMCEKVNEETVVVNVHLDEPYDGYNAELMPPMRTFTFGVLVTVEPDGDEGAKHFIVSKLPNCAGWTGCADAVERGMKNAEDINSIPAFYIDCLKLLIFEFMEGFKNFENGASDSEHGLLVDGKLKTN